MCIRDSTEPVGGDRLPGTLAQLPRGQGPIQRDGVELEPIPRVLEDDPSELAEGGVIVREAVHACTVEGHHRGGHRRRGII